MAYTVKYDDKIDSVRTHIEGKVDLETAEKFAQEGIKLAREKGGYRFLLDWRNAVIEVSMMDVYAFAEEQRAMGLQLSDKVANIVGENQPAHAIFETFARNRGYYNIRYFETEERAVDWLLSSE